MDISYINDKFSLEKLTKRPNHTNIFNYIIFDHTDNKKARESIEQALLINRKNIIIISTGNEEDYGQVLISSNNGSSKSYSYSDFITSTDRRLSIFNNYVNVKDAINKEASGKVYITNMLPSLLEVYKDFKDTEKPSCTDITLIDDQSMPINSLVAQLAYNAFYMIIAGKSLNYNMVRCNINNTYSTNYISHPFDLRDLYCKSLFGDCSPEAYEVLNQVGIRNGFDEKILLKKENIKYSKMIIDILDYYHVLKEETRDAIINYNEDIDANL